MMRTLSVNYSKSIPAILNISPESFEQEAKTAMAMKLYEMGRLTSGQAASLAGISRITFLLNCEKFGVSSVIWDEDEIKAEFQE